jgi:hypothetical protein
MGAPGEKWSKRVRKSDEKRNAPKLSKKRTKQEGDSTSI